MKSKLTPAQLDEIQRAKIKLKNAAKNFSNVVAKHQDNKSSLLLIMTTPDAKNEKIQSHAWAGGRLGTLVNAGAEIILDQPKSHPARVVVNMVKRAEVYNGLNAHHEEQIEEMIETGKIIPIKE